MGGGVGSLRLGRKSGICRIFGAQVHIDGRYNSGRNFDARSGSALSRQPCHRLDRLLTAERRPHPPDCTSNSAASKTPAQTDPTRPPSNTTHSPTGSTPPAAPRRTGRAGRPPPTTYNQVPAADGAASTCSTRSTVTRANSLALPLVPKSNSALISLCAVAACSSLR